MSEEILEISDLINTKNIARLLFRIKKYKINTIIILINRKIFSHPLIQEEIYKRTDDLYEIVVLHKNDIDSYKYMINAPEGILNKKHKYYHYNLIISTFMNKFKRYLRIMYNMVQNNINYEFDIMLYFLSGNKYARRMHKLMSEYPIVMREPIVRNYRNIAKWIQVYDALEQRLVSNDLNILFTIPYKGYINFIPSKAIKWACKNGKIVLVKKLLAYHKLIRPDFDDLVLACENKYIELIKLLLQLKYIDPGKDNNMLIKKYCCSYDIIKILLLSTRIDPTVNDNYALRYAGRSNHFDIVDLLLKDKRIREKGTENAMKYAIKYDHKKMIEILSSHQ